MELEYCNDPDYRPNRHRRTVTLTAAVIVLVLAAAITVAVARHPRQVVRTVTGTKPTGLTGSAAQIAAQVAPLSATYSVECGGTDAQVPVTRLAAPGGVEKQSSIAGTALRAFLADNPWRAESPVSSSNWALLSATPDRLILGQRQGAIGVGSVVTLKKQGPTFVPATLSGCGYVIPGAGESSAFIEDVTSNGTSLVVRWQNGVCDKQVLERTEIKELPDAVHILLVLTAAPGSPGIAIQCGDVGITSTSTVTLSSPLNGRPLYNDGKVPPVLIQTA